MGMRIEKLDFYKHHELALSMMKLSKYTKDFGNRIYSGEDVYKNGGILGFFKNEDLIGVASIRHCKRRTYTSVYFICIQPKYQGMGYGELFLIAIGERSPHKCIRLRCSRLNVPAFSFYEKLGYKIISEEKFELPLLEKMYD